MNVKFKKIISDLVINPWRTVLIIIALVIGLWGVGSILVSYSILSNDLNRNFMNTWPAHAVIESNNFDRISIEEVRKIPDVKRAEFRDFATLRIETRPDEWIPLWLFGVEDFKDFNIARFFDRTGNQNPVVPKDGEMAVERDGLKFSDLKAGNKARVRSGGNMFNINVADIVFDPAQSPGTQDHLIYAYVNKKTFSEIVGRKTGERLMVSFRDVKSREDVLVKVNKLEAFFKNKGIKVEKNTIPKFESHPHQWQLNTLLFMVGSIGLLSFLMGAVLVSQLMSAILSRQVRQIGIMKAIGASRSKVFLIYTGMVLALGFLSGLIAIPLAIKFGYAYSYFVADILNFEVLTLSLPAVVYAGLVSAALLLPIILSLPAIYRGTKVSVLEALNDYGINRNDTDGRESNIPRWIPNNLVMAVRNILRRKRRLAVTILSMAIGVAIFNTGFNVQESVRHLLLDVDNSMRHDVQVVFINQMPKEKALSYFKGINNIDRIESWNGGRGGMQSMIIATDDGVGIVSLPYNTDLVGFRSINGRWLGNSAEPEVVMNQEAAFFYKKPVVGSYQNISIRGKKLRAKLVGIVDEVEKPKIYLDEKVYDSVANTGHLVNSLMFVAKDKSYDKVIELKRDIERAIVPTNLQTLYVLMQKERVKIIYDHLYIILVTLIFFASLVLVVSAMGMASATSINIMERTREIGVLRAIGATPRIINNMFITEGMITGFVSIVLGMIISYPLSMLASGFFGSLMLDEAELDTVFSFSGLVVTLVSTTIFIWLASRIPARGAVKVSTRKALSYE